MQRPQLHLCSSIRSPDRVILVPGAGLWNLMEMGWLGPGYYITINNLTVPSCFDLWNAGLLHRPLRQGYLDVITSGTQTGYIINTNS
ncbi:hypothetical protein VTI28DRAFT_7622 [Corynascus sepedonium]